MSLIQKKIAIEELESIHDVLLSYLGKHELDFYLQELKPKLFYSSPLTKTILNKIIEDEVNSYGSSKETFLRTDGICAGIRVAVSRLKSNN